MTGTTYTGVHRGNLELREGDDVSALTEVTGYVDVREGGSFTANALTADIYYEIVDAGYFLFANSVSYKAGCRGPWDAATALKHWKRTDVRAVEFTAAIIKHEASKLAVAA